MNIHDYQRDSSSSYHLNKRDRMRKERNAYVSILKLLSASFIVFIHTRFPGDLGRTMDCLARFAVPLFLTISGYYSYRIDVATIKRRLRKILIFALLSNFIYFLYGFLREIIVHGSAGEYLNNIFDIKTIALFIFAGKNPFSEHLWYLSAMVLMYIVLIFFTVFFGNGNDVRYKEAYVIAVCAFMFQIAFGLKAQSVDIEINYLMYRYFLFFGFAFFTYGLLLHEHGEQIAERFGFTCGKAIIVIIVGIVLSLVQWFGIGKVELPLGMFLVVTALALMAFVKPGPLFSSNGFFNGIEIVATVVYIIHPLIRNVINDYAYSIVFFNQIRSAEYLFPLFVLCVSILMGAIVAIVLLSRPEKNENLMTQRE